MKVIIFWTLGAVMALYACAAPREGKPETHSLSVSSSAYAEGGMIPSRYTEDGDDIHPPISISLPPEGCRSIALIMEDPDAPMGTWVHWIAWQLPPDIGEIPEGKTPGEAVEGMNSWGRREYGGPAPPSGTHRYYLDVYALDSRLDLPPTANAAELRKAIKGHVLATGRLMGRYRR